MVDGRRTRREYQGLSPAVVVGQHVAEANLTDDEVASVILHTVGLDDRQHRLVATSAVSDLTEVASRASSEESKARVRKATNVRQDDR